MEVFFSDLTLGDIGTTDYRKAIDEALDSSRTLVAVATSRANLESEWVRYEWESFDSEVLSGVNSDGQVFSYVSGMAPKDLPRALRQRQCIVHEIDGPGRLFKFVAAAIKPDLSRDRPLNDFTDNKGKPVGDEYIDLNLRAKAAFSGHLVVLKVSDKESGRPVPGARATLSVITDSLHESAASNISLVPNMERTYAPVISESDKEGTVLFGILPDLAPTGSVSCVASVNSDGYLPTHRPIHWPRQDRMVSALEHSGAAWAVGLSLSEAAGREPNEVLEIALSPG